MRVAIIPNYHAKGVNTLLPRVCQALQDFGVEVLLPKSNVFPPPDCDDLIASSDLVLALGGDGTLIHTAKYAAKFSRAVLGVNCGHLGFMAGLEGNDLSALSLLLSKDFTVSMRAMLEVTLHRENGTCTVFHALNEAVVSRGNVSRMVSLSVFSDDNSVISYKADGVIVATPTGSTAYSLSAGGPVIDPSVNCLLVTPVCPHSLHTRPYVFADTAVITLKPEGEHEVYLTVDGEDAASIGTNDRITVKRSPSAARIIQMKPKAFYEVLNQKLMDR